jgi:hypothetical protein
VALGLKERRGFAPECTTLMWNVVGIVVLAVVAIAARSVALAPAVAVPNGLRHCSTTSIERMTAPGGARCSVTTTTTEVTCRWSSPPRPQPDGYCQISAHV